jgi:hypothetical protein
MDRLSKTTNNLIQNIESPGPAELLPYLANYHMRQTNIKIYERSLFENVTVTLSLQNLSDLYALQIYIIVCTTVSQ